MRNAVEIEALYFETTVKLENGEEKVIEIPSSGIGASVPEKLSVDEALKMGINLAQCRNEAGALAFSKEEIEKINQCKENVQNINEQQHVIVSDTQVTSAFEENGNKLLLSINDEFMEPARIFTPSPIKKREFLKDNTASMEHAGIASDRIYEFIKRRYKVRVYQEDFYIFDENEGIYRMLSANNFDRVVNLHFGSMLENPSGLACYYEVKEFARRDHQLFINSANFLPFKLWGFKNGILNIETNELIKNDGSYFLLHVLNCQYTKDAACPLFDNYLASIAGGDGNLISLLWECVAYMLSRDTNAKKFFAFIGKKDTGKSLFARILTGIIGEDAVSHLSANEFAGRFDSAGLMGKYLNVCMDLPDRPLTVEAVGKIKAITGNDVIHADRKYKEPIDFRPTVRLLFGANAQIRTDQFDPAFNERLIVIPFLYPVPKNRQDFNLEKKLLEEREGICQKAIKIYMNLRSKAYHFTEIEWGDEGNSYIDYDVVIQKFAEEFCEFTEKEADKITSSELFALFSDFCISKTIAPLSLNEFSKKLKHSFEPKVVKKKIKFNGVSVWGFVGVRFKSANTTE